MNLNAVFNKDLFRFFSRVAGPILGVCLFAAINPRIAHADRGGYTIRNFHTDLTVEENAELLVTERLEVDFSESRHGLYRMIPIRMTDRLGTSYSLGFKLLSVTDDNGNAHGVKSSHTGRYVKIRIGDPDRTVQGRVVYNIRYRIRQGVRGFTEHDEVYWNATGNEWQAAIERATATVRLPTPLDADSLEASGYTGSHGSRAQDVNIRFPEPGIVTFETRNALRPLEGLTISAAWPRGHIRFPGTAEKARRFFASNIILLVPVAVGGWLWRKYKGSGRDPQGPAAVMVRYDPPEGMTPAEIGTLVDERVDLRDITAVVVDLAVREYLVIRVEKKDVFFGLTTKEETVFERGSKAGDDLLPHEKIVLNGIFESGDRVEVSDLKEQFYTNLPKIRKALFARLTDSGHFQSNPESVRTKYQVSGVVSGIGVALAGVLWAKMLGGVFPLAALPAIAAGFLTLVLFIIFAPTMPQKTKTGVKVRNWALGFEEFIDRVERERLDAAEARNTFERLLPYAMALGVAAKWARKFEGIYASGTSPAWYAGTDPTRGFTTRSLEQNLASSMSDVGKNMAASPRSSGSGGGGFSGGGGGGGGGGSW